jgi:uncharacterized membrane protein YhaH (DUF805 family)
MNWYLEVLRKYVVFEGRARRKEYWFFVLFNFLIGIVLGIIDAMAGTPMSPLYSLAILLPSIAVAVRRLHDTDRSGWWILIGLVPILGVIVLLIFFVTDGTEGTNRFGDDPKLAPEP